MSIARAFKIFEYIFTGYNPLVAMLSTLGGGGVTPSRSKVFYCFDDECEIESGKWKINKNIHLMKLVIFEQSSEIQRKVMLDSRTVLDYSGTQSSVFRYNLLSQICTQSSYLLLRVSQLRCSLYRKSASCENDRGKCSGKFAVLDTIFHFPLFKRRCLAYA